MLRGLKKKQLPRTRSRRGFYKICSIFPLGFVLGGLLAMLLAWMPMLPGFAQTDLNSAQALNRQGVVYLNQGKPEKALEAWEAATSAYEATGNRQGAIQAQLNQVQALRELGFHRRALEILEQLGQSLEPEENEPLKAITLQRHGDLLRLAGDVDEAEPLLETSIGMLQRLLATDAQSMSQNERVQLQAAVGAARFSLAEIMRDRGEIDLAIAEYEEILELPLPTALQQPIQQARLEILMEQERFADAESLWPKMQQQLAGLPASRANIYHRIHLAETVSALPSVKSRRSGGQQSSIQLLSTATHQAQKLGDLRAKSYALGTLGQLYEQSQQWKKAQRLTQEAATLSQSLNAPDVTYRWLWQLGRIARQQGEAERAMTLYREALKTLQSLRQDLASINPNIQFSFRKDIEPLYRELVDLLLQEPAQAGRSEQPAQSDALAEARNVIESLQLAEIENFLQKACDFSATANADEVDVHAAVIYPIILPDRLEMIVSLPQQPLRRYTTAVNRQELQETLQQYRQGLVIRSRRDFYKPGQTLYEWLIQPMAETLQANEIETLVFVLDSSFKNVPMAALYDGESFLLEQYKIAVTPGLQLLGPQPLESRDLAVLAAGISEASHGFSALSHVENELDLIQQVSSRNQVLLNQQFTTPDFQAQVAAFSSPVLHLATHGQFSSEAKETFILAWDAPIALKEFDQILRGAPEGIDMLVLSACETARGDDRAALGLTGVAVEAGAKSTLATLWTVDDAASAALMGEFYERLVQPGTPRAEALRQAQLTLLKEPMYRHPLYWAPYVMVGNWL